VKSNGNKILIISIFVIFLAIPLLCERVEAGARKRVSVSAAISLKDSLNELKKLYEEKDPGVELELNLASSGLLQKQIEEGAPVDLFISAGKRQMDELAAKGLIVPATRFDLLGNELVLIVAKEKKKEIKGFSDLSRKGVTFSIGQPEIVPAGKYGLETLKSLKLWESLSGRVVYAKDVRQVLAYVDSGNVDAGLVYKSDTVLLKESVIAAVAPRGSHSPIVYPAAIVKGSKNIKEAEKFLAFLKSPEASAVFARFGFVPLVGKR
jgi:molybdate transport system substrate-binding protein